DRQVHRRGRVPHRAGHAGRDRRGDRRRGARGRAPHETGELRAARCAGPLCRPLPRTVRRTVLCPVRRSGQADCRCRRR
ncbi:hypothetical protein LTR94_036868, partial [Friedmanniomyces endolithicus]